MKRRSFARSPGGGSPEDSGIPFRFVPERYSILQSISSRGAVSVFKVLDQESGRVLALKVLGLAGTSPAELELFKLEFARLSALEHPRVVRVYEFGLAGECSVFFTMEFLEGRHFDVALAGRPIGDIVEACLQVCDALHYLHSRRIVHGDIKPSNVLLSVEGRTEGKDRGGNLSLKVTDFGLARMLQEAGVAGGTYSYVAPEVIRGLPVDGRADLYSLGVVLYELLTGSRVFPNATGQHLLRAHLLSRPVSPRDIDPAVPLWMQSAILKLLEKDPGLRYRSAEELAETLRDAMGDKGRLAITDPVPVTLLSPSLTGREKETGMLREAMSTLQTRRRGGLFVLSAGFGSGKTRLLEWLRFTASAEGHRVGFADFGELEADCSTLFLKWSGRILDLHQPGATRDTEWSRSQDLPPQARQGELGCEECGPSLLGTIFPARSPSFDSCIVILDDIHLASPSLLRGLADFVPTTRVLPVLLVCSYEPEAMEATREKVELRSLLASSPDVVEITLTPLSEGQTLSLVSSVLGMEVSDELESLSAWVHRASQGIPGTAEEILGQLAARGSLRRLGNRLVCSLPDETELLASISVPATLRRKVASLSPEDRDFLRGASIAGNAFSVDDVGVLLGWEPARVASAAAHLKDNDIVRAAESRHYSFVNPAVRSLVYAEAEDETRRVLHEKMAALLEREGVQESAARLAAHYERAGHVEKALVARLKAVESARKMGRHNEALSHAEAALPGLRKRGPSEALGRLLVDAADSAQQLGRHRQASNLMEERLTLVPAGSAEERAEISLRLGGLYMRQSLFGQAEAKLREALDTASKLQLSNLRSEALSDLAWTLFGLSKTDEALFALEEASCLISAGNEPAAAAIVENRRGVVLSKTGLVRESEEAHTEAVRLAELSREPGVLGTCLNNLGLVLLKTGRLKEADAALSRACETTYVAGDAALLSTCYNNLGIVRKERLDLDGALDSYLKSMELRRRCGDFAGSSLTATNVAVLYRLKGEIRQAFRYYQESYRMASEFAPDADRSTSAINMGEIEGMRGNLQEAEKYYLEALAAREKAGDSDGVAFCATGLGYAFMRNGDPEAAVQWARRALDSANQGSRERFAAGLLLVEALSLAGRIEEARAQLDRIVEQEGEATPAMLGIEKRVRGIVLEDAGRLADAVESFRSSCSLLGDAGDSLERARSLFFLGKALLASSSEGVRDETAEQKLQYLREAISVLEESNRILERMEAGPERADCLSFLAVAYRELASLLGSGGVSHEAGILVKVAGLVNSALPLSVVLERIMDMAIEKTGAERGLIALMDQQTGDVEKVLSRSLEGETERDAFEISRTVLRRVAQGGYALLTPDAAGDPELRDVKSVVRLEIRSVLCVPLRARNRLMGAVYLDHRSLPGAFGPREQSFMEGFADLAGMAIEGTRLREELQRAGEILSRENIELRKHVASQHRFDQIIGESPEMKRVFSAMEKVARSSATVLIVGESGTGKELVARAIHSNSERRDRPFVPVNCAAIPRDLIEGELFGIEDRVATGVSKRSGYFEQAGGGTIFLDEIGDMSLELQSKLLRVLQEKEFKRIGGRHNIAVDVRIICATNKNLLQEIANGSFRSDLYYRISGIPIELPPLRQRRGDIPRLVEFFITKYGIINKVDNPPRVTPELMNVLVEADWGGNVRELENCVERFVVMCSPGEEIPLSMLPERLTGLALGRAVKTASGPRKLREEMQELERERLAAALVRHRGNRSRAARELGISEQSVRYKIHKYRLNVRQLCRDAVTDYGP